MSERPHFTERLRTLNAVRLADRVAPSVVGHNLHMARVELGSLLRGSLCGFYVHLIELQLDRFSRARLRRLEVS